MERWAGRERIAQDDAQTNMRMIELGHAVEVGLKRPSYVRLDVLLIRGNDSRHTVSAGVTNMDSRRKLRSR